MIIATKMIITSGLLIFLFGRRAAAGRRVDERLFSDFTARRPELLLYFLDAIFLNFHRKYM